MYVWFLLSAGANLTINKYVKKIRHNGLAHTKSCRCGRTNYVSVVYTWKIGQSGVKVIADEALYMSMISNAN